MKRPRIELPAGAMAVDGQVVTRGSRKRWPSHDAELARQRKANDAARRDAHLAEHGPHTCTPDPADPWSVCHLDQKERTP